MKNNLSEFKYLLKYNLGLNRILNNQPKYNLSINKGIFACLPVKKAIAAPLQIIEQLKFIFFFNE